MGMMGEIHASIEARKLQKVLIKAIESENSEIIKFCQDNIIPLYDEALGESFSNELFESEENKKIIHYFNNY